MSISSSYTIDTTSVSSHGKTPFLGRDTEVVSIVSAKRRTSAPRPLTITPLRYLRIKGDGHTAFFGAVLAAQTMLGPRLTLKLLKSIPAEDWEYHPSVAFAAFLDKLKEVQKIRSAANRPNN